MNEEQIAQAVADAKAAIAKINEGLSDFLKAIQDEGEPEIVQNALLLFESQGMAEHGLFHRQQYICLENSGSVTAMLGMFELLSERIQHDIRCSGGISE